MKIEFNRLRDENEKYEEKIARLENEFETMRASIEKKIQKYKQLLK